MNSVKILFINPEIKGEVVASYFPLGIAYLSSVLKEKGFSNIKVLDYNLKESPEKEKEIIKWKPDFIGVTMMVSSFPGGKEKIEYLKSKIKDTKIFVGGIAAAVIPEEVLKINGVDGVYRGEGEGIIENLVKESIVGNTWKKLPGISYLNNEEVVSNPLFNFIDDLDSIPFPDRTLAPFNYYLQETHGTERKTATLMTSRGCPFQCVFCYRGPAAGKKFRARTAQNIFQELELLEKEHGVTAFMFWDDNFLLDKKRVFEFCDLIKNKDYHWKCQLRVDSVDEDLIKKMKNAGCVAANIGVESGNEKILKLMKKGITKDQARKALRLCRKYGIFTNIYFILGTPWDTLETMEETINFAKELQPNEAHFFEAAPHPGTELREVAVSMGLKINDHWGKYLMKKMHPSIMESKNFTRDELKEVLVRANSLFNDLVKKMK